MTKKGEVAKYFNESVLIETDDCILWEYSVDANGYGFIWRNNKITRAHREALIVRVGQPPEGKPYALHAPLLCHNPSCFNYRHLRWGSGRENMRDSRIDGTLNTGENHGSSKISNEMRMRIALDERSLKSIMNEYGISKSSIYYYRRMYGIN